MRQNSLNYKISTMSMNNEQNMCGNCRSHGIVEDGVIKVPCMNCACDNGYEWNGKKCYGVGGLNEKGVEASLDDLIATFYILVRPRYGGGGGSAPSCVPGTDQSVDEYILDNFIPDEGKDLYKKMVILNRIPLRT